MTAVAHCKSRLSRRLTSCGIGQSPIAAPGSTAARGRALADEIAPAASRWSRRTARGVFLMPEQENLLFWGIHALAAARRTDFAGRCCVAAATSPDSLDRFLGNAITETLNKIVISIFDGDPEPLLATCADKGVDEVARWNLVLALARLTFDGRIPHATTLAFLDRFDRESLADSGDAAWDGWQDAVTLLGLEQMRDRMRATWTGGRNPPSRKISSIFRATLTVAQALAPGDPALFVPEGHRTGRSSEGFGMACPAAARPRQGR